MNVQKKISEPEGINAFFGGIYYVNAWILFFLLIILSTFIIFHDGAWAIAQVLIILILALFLGRGLWEGRHEPVVSVTTQGIQWKSPFSRQSHFISVDLVLNVETNSSNVIVLGTNLKESVRIDLKWLSKEDKKKIRDVIMRLF